MAAIRAQILPQRYLRNLGTVGWEGQLALLCASVGIVGCGGLGGWIAEGLARMGIGRLVLIDGDRFQEDNLNRQLGCTEATLGQPKVDALIERLAQVNSGTELVGYQSYLTRENAPILLAGVRVIVDAVDTLPARFLLQEIAAQQRVPLVHGAIAGYNGQVMVIYPGDPGLHALYGEHPPLERGIETQLGNPAATPMMIAAWQIQQVVKIVTGQEEGLLRGRLLLLDAAAGEIDEIPLS